MLLQFIWSKFTHFFENNRYVVIADINTPINKSYMPYTTGVDNNIFVQSSSGKGFMEVFIAYIKRTQAQA